MLGGRLPRIARILEHRVLRMLALVDHAQCFLHRQIARLHGAGALETAQCRYIIALLEMVESHAAQGLEVVRLQPQHHGPFIVRLRALPGLEVQHRKHGVRFDVRRMVFEAAQTKLERRVTATLLAEGTRERQEGQRRRVAGNFFTPALQIRRCRCFHRMAVVSCRILSSSRTCLSACATSPPCPPLGERRRYVFQASAARRSSPVRTALKPSARCASASSGSRLTARAKASVAARMRFCAVSVFPDISASSGLSGYICSSSFAIFSASSNFPSFNSVSTWTIAPDSSPSGIEPRISFTCTTPALTSP